jgi:chromosomal replication initiation ATPase DnaA
VKRPVVPALARGWLDSQLHPRLTFETFVVGASNRFTHAGCTAVASHPGEVYNPLFIFGGSGLGKTHLLHAVGHAVKGARPEARVHYVPAERFVVFDSEARKKGAKVPRKKSSKKKSREMSATWDSYRIGGRGMAG